MTLAAPPWAPLHITGACTACGLCLATCPERALVRAPGRPRLLAERCTLCLACVEVCPVDAITESAGATSTAGGATSTADGVTLAWKSALRGPNQLSDPRRGGETP